MKIGIVGSRRRNSSKDKQSVYNVCFDQFTNDNELHIISGGCEVGADHFAELFAKEFGCPITIFYPLNHPKPSSYSDAVQRFYHRNQKIAETSDVMYAFVSADRKGGTENTIKFAKQLNKNIMLVMPDGSITKELT